MKVSVNTETDELSELRATIAIIEDAIKRRENPNYEEKEELEEDKGEVEPEEIKEEGVAPVDLSPISTADYEGESEVQEEIKLDNKEIIKNIITMLKDKNPGQPIQMQDIIDLAKEKNVGEDETRDTITKLQNSGEI